MKRCGECGRLHNDEVTVCDCGAGLGSVLPEERKKGATDRLSGAAPEANELRYPALSAMGSAFGFLGWIVILGSILSGLISAWGALGGSGLAAGVIWGVSSIVGGLIVGLPMLACRDLIRWMFSMEYYAQRTGELLNRLKSSPER